MSVPFPFFLKKIKLYEEKLVKLREWWKKKTWAPKRETQIKPIQECRLKKLATIPSSPWNFVQIPKTPEAKATPWRHKCTDFLEFLEPGSHLCTRIARNTKYSIKQAPLSKFTLHALILNKVSNFWVLSLPSPLTRIKPITMNKGWRACQKLNNSKTNHFCAVRVKDMQRRKSGTQRA